MANAEGSDLHVRKALALNEQSARDWEAIVKLDPSNQITWHNLVAERMGIGYWSSALGRVGEAREAFRSALALESRLNESSLNAEILACAAGYAAMFEADSGSRHTAEAALRANRRFSEIAVRGLSPDSFGGSFFPELLGYYGCFTFVGISRGYGAYALPFGTDDQEAVRSLARASAKRLEQMKSPSPQRELDRIRTLDFAYRTAAEASYRLKDYAAADAEIKRGLELHEKVPKRNLFEKRDANEELMLAAMIAARLERYPEAQQLIEPVLKFHRQLYARSDNDDLNQRVELARALYVWALAAPGQKSSQLTEAVAILDGLPAEMRRQASISVWRDWIAEEQKKRH
jgi:tetratricopeptide (TPR) repeat protein